MINENSTDAKCEKIIPLQRVKCCSLPEAIFGERWLASEWEEAYRAWLESEQAYWNLDYERKLAATNLEYATGTLSSYS